MEAILRNTPCDLIDFDTSKCFTWLIAKGLSWVIVLGSLTFKFPVIKKILKLKNCSGLTKSGVYLETTSFATQCSYAMLKGNPFSSYGETFFSLLQNFFIILLMWRWTMNGERESFPHIAIALTLAALYTVTMINLPPNIQPFLVLISTCLSISSRLPQIISNHKNQTIGVQARSTSTVSAVSSGIKVFVAIVELKDIYRAIQSFISFSLHSILVIQIYLMEQKEKRKEEKVNSKKSD